jgi:hypothetical protein
VGQGPSSKGTKTTTKRTCPSGAEDKEAAIEGIYFHFIELSLMDLLEPRKRKQLSKEYLSLSLRSP